MTKVVLFASLLLVSSTFLQAAKAFSEEQVIEAQVEEASVTAARQLAQKVRNELIDEAKLYCITESKVFEVRRNWTQHRKSGFKWVALAGSIVSCE
jgi:hypothetical protein